FLLSSPETNRCWFFKSYEQWSIWPSVGRGMISTSRRSPDICSMGDCLLTYGWDCCCPPALKTKIVHKPRTMGSFFIHISLDDFNSISARSQASRLPNYLQRKL